MRFPEYISVSEEYRWILFFYLFKFADYWKLIVGSTVIATAIYFVRDRVPPVNKFLTRHSLAPTRLYFLFWSAVVVLIGFLIFADEHIERLNYQQQASLIPRRLSEDQIKNIAEALRPIADRVPPGVLLIASDQNDTEALDYAWDIKRALQGSGMQIEEKSYHLDIRGRDLRGVNIVRNARNEKNVNVDIFRNLLKGEIREIGQVNSINHRAANQDLAIIIGQPKKPELLSHK
jgi:hypothetical protein